MPRIYTTRTRFNTDLSDRPYHHVLHGSDTFGAYPSFTHFSSISDNVNKRRRGFYPESDCINTKVKGSLIANLPGYYEWNGYVTAVKYPPYCRPELVLGMLPTISEASWDGFFYDAFIDFGTQIPEETNVYNFLWEFREIGDLLPKLERSFRQTVSGGYLNYQFGWKPFLEDLATLGNIVSIIEKRLSHLIEINGKTTRLSAVKPDIYSLPYIRDWVDPSNYNVWFMRLRSYSATFRASGRLTANLEQLQDHRAFWRAAAVALGLANPVKAFWDAIPFSFVLGWFNRIGARLFDIRQNPFQGRYDVDRLSTSLSEVATIDFKWSHNGQSVPIGSWAVTRYTRHSGFPAKPSIFNIEALSPKQQTLMLAMLNT